MKVSKKVSASIILQLADGQKIIALDPGLRTFLTGFEGKYFTEYAGGDFARISKLCSQLDKLKSKHDFAVTVQG